jgi:Fe-S-cluster containining protein
MASHSDSPADTLERVEQLLAEISDTTSKFESSVQYKCRKGCGACCLKPTIEAQVVEMLPMAKHIIDSGRFDEVYEKLSIRDDGPCQIFEADIGGMEKGRCSAYEFRPSVCRLFGFSAVKKKTGPPELANCNWQKKLYPHELSDAQQKINSGMSVPIISDYGFQLQNIASSAAMGTLMPINRALKIALEKQMMADQYRLSDLGTIESLP